VGTQKDDVRRGRGSAGRPAATSVTIRSAQRRDAAAVAALLGDLGYPASEEQAAQRIDRIGDDPSIWLIVAELDSEIAGFGALHTQTLIERDDIGSHVAALVVAERFRRRGVGEALMATLEDEARARGSRYLALNTAHRRADAHAFYEALGYEHTGRRYAKELG
jgi:ribosomal protein S18 acetylase RimI-like enzyme